MSALAKMPKNSRVWIYQSDRQLSTNEVETIKSKGDIFIKNWTSHEKQMNASIEVEQDVFVIVALDESSAGASGCGIDKLVKFIQAIGSEFKIDFFNRLRIAYINNLGKVDFFNASSINALMEKGILTNDSIIFCNHQVGNLYEMQTNWKQQLSESWLSHNYSTK
jgi:hypothetical protein